MASPTELVRLQLVLRKVLLLRAARAQAVKKEAAMFKRLNAVRDLADSLANQIDEIKV